MINIPSVKNKNTIFSKKRVKKKLKNILQKNKDKKTKNMINRLSDDKYIKYKEKKYNKNYIFPTIIIPATIKN